MIYQRDPEFPAAVQFWGCYLLSLCERMSSYFPIPFTHDEVLDTLRYGQAYKFIDEEITILSPQALCDHLAAGKVLFLGKRAPEYVTSDDEFEVVCYHKSGASFNHFCSGNGKGIVLYDPFGPSGSDSVRNGKVIGKRIYKLL